MAYGPIESFSGIIQIAPNPRCISTPIVPLHVSFELGLQVCGPLCVKLLLGVVGKRALRHRRSSSLETCLLKPDYMSTKLSCSNGGIGSSGS